MKAYLVVEGKMSENILYPKWIKYINDELKVVSKIEDVVENSIMIVTADGYPHYFEIIENGVKDIVQFDIFDKLIVAVDSEDFSYEEKFNEINDFLLGLKVPIEYNIIIQHFCIETWALGNKKIYQRNPQNLKLRSYQKLFNVARDNPELLPAFEKENFNRAQFASKYLNLLLQEKYNRLSYKKGAPNVVGEKYYFEQLIKRYDKGHIQSFGKFIENFSK
jgi:hypothetical protein